MLWHHFSTTGPHRSRILLQRAQVYPILLPGTPHLFIIVATPLFLVANSSASSIARARLAQRAIPRKNITKIGAGKRRGDGANIL